MISVYKAADYFLTKDTMTHKKLQKLCYYAQVLYAGMYQEKLINTDFEAWVHGPVSRELFFKYKGKKEISKKIQEIELCEKEKLILNATYLIYGKLTGDALESLTHSEFPWLNARNGIDEATYSEEVINFEEIQKFGIEKIKEINK